MHIALFFWDVLPAPKYGGTQRMVVWLARGLAEAGHRVTLIAGHGSNVPETHAGPGGRRGRPAPGVRSSARCSLPGSTSCSAYAPLAVKPDLPWLRVLPGNWKPGTKAAPNIIYLSRDHAERHGSAAFVYNGLDPAEFRFRPAPRTTTISSSAGCTPPRATDGRSPARSACAGGCSSPAAGGRA